MNELLLKVPLKNKVLTKNSSQTLNELCEFWQSGCYNTFKIHVVAILNVLRMATVRATQWQIYMQMCSRLILMIVHVSKWATSWYGMSNELSGTRANVLLHTYFEGRARQRYGNNCGTSPPPTLCLSHDKNEVNLFLLVHHTHTVV